MLCSFFPFFECVLLTGRLSSYRLDASNVHFCDTERFSSKRVAPHAAKRRDISSVGSFVLEENVIPITRNIRINEMILVSIGRLTERLVDFKAYDHNTTSCTTRSLVFGINSFSAQEQAVSPKRQNRRDASERTERMGLRVHQRSGGLVRVEGSFGKCAR